MTERDVEPKFGGLDTGDGAPFAIPGLAWWRVSA